MDVQVNHSQRLEEWFKRFVPASRSEFSAIPARYEKAWFNLLDFTRPVQVVALWYKESAMEMQLVYVTHDGKRSDQDVIAVGPFPHEEMERQMSAILRLPQLQGPLEPEDAALHNEQTYAGVLKDYFLRAARGASQMARLPAHQGAAEPGAMMAFVYGGFTWIVAGDLTNTEPAEMAKRLVQDEIDRIERSRNPEPVSPGVKVEELRVDGFAGRFLPRLWLGKKPARTFEQRLKSGLIHESSFFICSYKGRFVRAEDRSSIFIESDSESEALRLLNEIGGGLLLHGVPCHIFRPGAIYQTSYQSKKIGAMTYNTFGAPPVTLDEAEYFAIGGISELQLQSFLEIQRDAFESVLQHTERRLDYEGKSDHLVALVESFTDLAGENYKGAFIGSWTIIESYCKTQRFLSKGNSFSEAYALAKKMRSSPEPVFEELDRLRHFGSPRSDEFSRLYEIRSRTVHSRMYSPSKEEATECYKLAEQLVRRELGLS